LTTWVVYTKQGNFPLWKSENKNDLDIMIKKLPDAINDKLYLAEAKKQERKNESTS
jgi:hypothetical protein